MDEEEVLNICKKLVDPRIHQGIQDGIVEEPKIISFEEWPYDFADYSSEVIWKGLKASETLRASKWLDRHGYEVEFLEVGVNEEGYEEYDELNKLELRVFNDQNESVLLTILRPDY